jgi:hypothetical protein
MDVEEAWELKHAMLFSGWFQIRVEACNVIFRLVSEL